MLIAVFLMWKRRDNDSVELNNDPNVPVNSNNQYSNNQYSNADQYQSVRNASGMYNNVADDGGLNAQYDVVDGLLPDNQPSYDTVPRNYDTVPQSQRYDSTASPLFYQNAPAAKPDGYHPAPAPAFQYGM
mmetsp:Transcript_9919/g.16667  ORF Transcript_9919/g.16667 Transcript_9919/m.16667 type:complete len:130 (+) Transcript_9919:1084-1473(+)